MKLEEKYIGKSKKEIISEGLFSKKIKQIKTRIEREDDKRKLIGMYNVIDYFVEVTLGFIKEAEKMDMNSDKILNQIKVDLKGLSTSLNSKQMIKKYRKELEDLKNQRGWVEKKIRKKFGAE